MRTKIHYFVFLLFMAASCFAEDASFFEIATKAAEQGYAKAQFSLGLIYNGSHGVAKNYA